MLCLSGRVPGNTNNAPTLPYKQGRPVVPKGAEQAPSERWSSIAKQLSNLTQMMSNLMAEVRRENYDEAPGAGRPDFRRDLFGSPPTMQPLDPIEDIGTMVPGTLQPDGQPMVFFQNSMANIDETGVAEPNVLPSSSSIVVRFVKPHHAYHGGNKNAAPHV